MNTPDQIKTQPGEIIDQQKIEKLKIDVEKALEEYQQFVENKQAEGKSDQDFYQYKNKNKVLKTLEQAGIETADLDVDISSFQGDNKDADRSVTVGYDLKILYKGTVIFDKRYIEPGGTYTY